MAGAVAGYVAKEIEQYDEPSEDEMERMWRGETNPVTFNKTQQEFILDDIDILLSTEEDEEIKFDDGTKLSSHHRFFEDDLRDVRRKILHADQEEDGSVEVELHDRHRLTLYDFIMSPLLKQRDRTIGEVDSEE